MDECQIDGKKDRYCIVDKNFNKRVQSIQVCFPFCSRMDLPETASHAAEQFSWVPLPCCSPPGCPFPIKSLALPAHVSPQTIHFRVLDKRPASGPGRGPPSCNTRNNF